LTHISDALGYMIFRLFPIKKKEAGNLGVIKWNLEFLNKSKNGKLILIGD